MNTEKLLRSFGMSKKNVILKFLSVGVLLAGMAQAEFVTVTLTPTETITQNNTTWQNVQSVSYKWNDADGDNAINVGDNVSFDIVMHKTEWGTHDYDAMKVWVGDEVIKAPVVDNQLTTLKSTGYEFLWDYSGYGNIAVPDGSDTKHFGFTYEFNAEGEYDLTASVMCSRDLSGLISAPNTPIGSIWNDSPTMYDFNAWDKDVHKDGTTGAGWTDWWGNWHPSALQGETKVYGLSVVAKNVPEPTILSLLGCGLLGLAFVRRKK
jgi:hypothetical protein